MNRAEEATLLQSYVETGSNEAFGRLVTRHFDLVYCSALRMVGGDSHLARDVAQGVFTHLARNARKLPEDVRLGGWLYQHTCFTAANAVRTERRRRDREQKAVEMNALNDSDESLWRQVAPILDEAMRQLDDTDRDAIVLRFFDRQPFRAVGEHLGTTEEAARKRVDRALEKLRGFFARRGLGVSALVLTRALEVGGATTAPAGMAAAVTAGVLAGAAHSAGGISLIKLIMLTKSNVMAAAAIAGLATAVVFQFKTNARLRDENSALQAQAGQLDNLRAENSKLLAQQTAAPPSATDSQVRELARLRGEVTGLKRQLAQAAAKPPAVVSDPAPETTPDPGDPTEQQKQLAIAKMNFSRQMVLAFLMYAGDNQGAYPTNFSQLSAYLPGIASQTPPDETVKTNLTTDQFEITYQGQTTNMADPSQVIVIREKDAWPGPGGGWMRSYGFGDGHSEIHKEAINDFSGYESQHIQLSAQR